MRYIDSGSRDGSQTLGHWLRTVLTTDIVEVRWQSGFFASDGLGLLVPTLERLTNEDRIVRVVIGSNQATTPSDDVLRLLELLGIPRPNASLGVVSYGGGAFFHPKTYHLQRADRSQCAYVGSANLTFAGVASLHVEAGVILDTRDGDDGAVLATIATGVDSWFGAERDGFDLVVGPESVEQLVGNGVLVETPSPRPPAAPRDGESRLIRPRLRPLVDVPSFGRSAPSAATPPVEPPLAIVNTSVPRPNFPPYLLFDPNAQDPTSGADALSGSPLPSGAVGLVVRLNRDSARGFSGGVGTSNISIPVATLSTLRFGVFRGRYERPRAEFVLRTRYLAQQGPFPDKVTGTNVMAYGFLPGEQGHGDVRMLVPTAAVRTVTYTASAAGLPVPGDGDTAFLEWPSAGIPEFRLTFLERGSAIFAQSRALFDRAAAAGEIVGAGACWLPRGLSPPW